MRTDPGARVAVVLLLGLLGALAGCSDDEELTIRKDGRVAVAVVVPPTAGPGLRLAADDLAEALGHIVWAPVGPVHAGSLADTVEAQAVHVIVDHDLDLGEACYRIDQGTLAPHKKGLRVRAASDVGAMYGLYHIAQDLGVRYFHPEDTFYPDDPDATLPWHYDGETHCPDFALRGFHEHTQHPIVMSDFYLRPGEPGFREFLSRYLRWLARNRQNLATFHMLKTVDLDRWLPYIADAVREARELGIHLGPILSFVDQQQNNFKLLAEDSLETEAQQITAGLDRFLTAGFDVFGFQIGSSEFTKPTDAATLERLNIAAAHLAARGVMAFTWIHITCSLHDDQGGYFYHLPLQADPAMGALVHTTMFYTLEHPAPVYDCETFAHQIDFMTAADGTRPQIFFPESAWWLGFDNNLPLILPITGWSREYDIQQVLPDHQVAGHLTFTSGREWTYWQYDHYLTQVTWDTDLTWADYLEWIESVYGGPGERVRDALLAWTELQRRHLYEDNPLIMFYLAGELPQDELGAAAGILARRPKLAFNELVQFDDARFAAWEADDLSLLESMRGEYQDVLDGLADPADYTGDGRMEQRLYREVYQALWVYVRRIEHAIALYRGVAAVRDWVRERDAAAAAEPPREPSEATRAEALGAAEAYLADAAAISADVIAVIRGLEADYRYPLDLLIRPKPESPTSYRFGYLEQTSTGYFWTRRDDQLAELIGRQFQTAVEEWSEVPEALFYTDKDHMEMTSPDSALAASAIGGFMPRLLFGLSGYDAGAGAVQLVVGQDSNENWLPDPLTEQGLTLLAAGGGWWGATREVFNIEITDSTGAPLATLQLLGAEFQLQLEVSGGLVTDLPAGSLAGSMPSDALIEIIVSIGGIDVDGATELVKSVYDIPRREELPATLPFAFALSFLLPE